MPRGAGSGLSGAANAIDGCVVLVLTKLDEIVEIDPGNRLAVVQPGVVNLDFRNTVEKHGLFYPPDPSSYDWCTIGGNLSTNAGGLCCVKYGVTTDSVLGLEVVLADGSLLKTGRCTVKGVAGYDLTRLFVGSEGTLGVITQATVRPRRCRRRRRRSSRASTPPKPREAVARVVARARCRRCWRSWTRRRSRRRSRTSRPTSARVRLPGAAAGQSDAGGEAARRELAALEQICADCGADLAYTTDDLEEARCCCRPAGSVLTALETYGVWLTDDVCVPRTRIAELIRGCEKISAEVGSRIAVVGHAGDGNMHPTIVYEPDDAGRVRPRAAAFDEILRSGSRSAAR